MKKNALIVLLLLDLLFVYISAYNSDFLFFLKLYVLFFFILVLFKMKFEKNLIITYYIVFFGLFYWGRLLGDLLNQIEFGVIESFVFFDFSTRTQILALLYTKISLTVFLLFNFEYKATFQAPYHDQRLLQIGKFLFFISAPFAIMKFIIQILTLSKYGLLAYYTGQAKAVSDIPLFIELSYNVLLVGYFTILASFPTEKDFNRTSLMFIIIAVLSGISGIRSLIILPILYFFWYKNRFYGKTLHKRSYIVVVTFLFIGFQVLGALRFGNDVKLSLIGPIISQGSGIRVLNLLIDSQDELEKGGFDNFIFAPLMFPIKYFKYGGKVVGQSEDAVMLRGDLNHTLTYFVRKGYYLTGGGLGSAFVAEAAEYGLFGVIFFTIILALFIKYFLRNDHKRFFMFFSYVLVTHIIIIARDTFFINMWGILKYAFGYFVVMVIYHLTRPNELRRKVQHTNFR